MALFVFFTGAKRRAFASPTVALPAPVTSATAASMWSHFRCRARVRTALLVSDGVALHGRPHVYQTLLLRKIYATLCD